MSSQPFKVLISGAGIAGPTVAYWLSRIPTRVPLAITVLERSPNPRPTGQAVDVRGSGVDVVQRMGLEAAIRACHTNERGFQRVTAAGAVVATFNASGDTSKQALTGELEILRADLARILCDAAAARPGVEFVYGDYLSSLSQAGEDGGGRVRVEFTNGKLPAGVYDLVVGADGLMSRTRPFVTGRPVKDDLRDLGAYVAYFTIPPGGADSPTHARQWGVVGGRVVFTRPCSAGTGVYLFAVREDAALGAALKQDIAAQKAAITAAFTDIGPEGPRILAGMQAADDFYFHQVAQVRAERWAAGRVALVGDAGFCPGSPFTGMGTTLGVHGAYILAGELSQALRTGGDGDVPAALARYEAVLRPYVTKIQKIPPGLHRITHPLTEWGISTLNAVMWAVSASGITKLFNFGPSETERAPDYDWVEA
jgi:2-polyprenyl-6-methoxyphenol hydroxylase-like FAD-dependent oxidoreductase